MNTNSTYEKVPEWALDEARFDQAPVDPHTPLRGYAICSTPRSGSWLLCRQLVNAGLGVPTEYFNGAHAIPMCQRWGVDGRDRRAYVEAVRAHRTTPNGVWGMKLLWTHFALQRNVLKVEVLAKCLPILLYREDVVPQAVSLHLSYLTGMWDFDGTIMSIPRTDIPWGDPGHLAACEREVVEQNRHWREQFAMRGLVGLIVRYEDLVADQPGTIVRIAKALGLSPSDYRVPPPEPRETAFPEDVEAKRRDLVAAWREQRAA